jgi:hypothetical protein
MSRACCDAVVLGSRLECGHRWAGVPALKLRVRKIGYSGAVFMDGQVRVESQSLALDARLALIMVAYSAHRAVGFRRTW